MVKDITIQRWQEAQEAERAFHVEAFDAGYLHYRESYGQYFDYLRIHPDLKGKNIVEIGPADFPALAYCLNIGTKSIVVEPMPSENLKRSGLTIVTGMAENLEYEADEVWLMNVLQHVVNPHAIVDRAKKQAKVIRFFEPINYGIDTCHPWNLTMDMFHEWFGESVRHYPADRPVRNFHTWECAYGIWTKSKLW